MVIFVNIKGQKLIKTNTKTHQIALLLIIMHAYPLTPVASVQL